MSHLKVARRVSKKPEQEKKAHKPAWQAVFATKEDYDRSVASVVARIRSGEVQPREPDEDEE